MQFCQSFPQCGWKNCTNIFFVMFALWTIYRNVYLEYALNIHMKDWIILLISKCSRHPWTLEYLTLWSSYKSSIKRTFAVLTIHDLIQEWSFLTFYRHPLWKNDFLTTLDGQAQMHETAFASWFPLKKSSEDCEVHPYKPNVTKSCSKRRLSWKCTNPFASFQWKVACRE